MAKVFLVIKVQPIQLRGKWGLDIQFKIRNIFTKFRPFKILEEESVYRAAQTVNLKNLQGNIKQVDSTTVAKNTT